MEEETEWLDLVNEQDEVIAVVARDRTKPHRQNVRVVNAFLINSAGEIWFPRRTPTKTTFPNCLDMSVGGYVQSGETYEQAFRRETLEELNLDVDKLPWREIASFSPFQTSLSAFMRVYEIQSDTAPQFNPDDFSGGEWLTPAQVLGRMESGDPAKSDLAELVGLCYSL